MISHQPFAKMTNCTDGFGTERQRDFIRWGFLVDNMKMCRIDNRRAGGYNYRCLNNSTTWDFFLPKDLETWGMRFPAEG